MSSPLIGAIAPTTEIKHNVQTYNLGMKVSEGMTLKNEQTWRLSTGDGLFTMVLPKKLLPWAVEGDVIVCSSTFFKSIMVSTIMKGEADAKAN